MILACPVCREELRAVFAEAASGSPRAWRCPSCAREYPVRDGVVCFEDRQDEFYEGRFVGTKRAERPLTLLGRIVFPLRLAWSIDLYYTRLLRKFLRPEHKRVLDLGCGGGNTELLRRGAQVAGVDLSFASLRDAAAVYRVAAQVSAARLPFRDDYFDAVVSSNFLGHVPPAEKDAVFSEMRRVARPGALLIHEIETSSEGPIWRHAARDPDYYRRRVVELDGHFGLESPSETFARFRRHGFEIVRAHTAFVWYFLPQGEATKRFDDPLGRRNAGIRVLLAVDRLTAGRPRLRKAVNLLAGAANNVCRAFTPIDKGVGAYVAARKRGSRPETGVRRVEEVPNDAC